MIRKIETTEESTRGTSSSILHSSSNLIPRYPTYPTLSHIIPRYPMLSHIPHITPQHPAYPTLSHALGLLILTNHVEKCSHFHRIVFCGSRCLRSGLQCAVDLVVLVCTGMSHPQPLHIMNCMRDNATLLQYVPRVEKPQRI